MAAMMITIKIEQGEDSAVLRGMLIRVNKLFPQGRVTLAINFALSFDGTFYVYRVWLTNSEVSFEGSAHGPAILYLFYLRVLYSQCSTATFYDQCSSYHLLYRYRH